MVKGKFPKIKWLEIKYCNKQAYFSGFPGVSSNLHFTEGSSPTETIHLFFNNKILRLIQTETNINAEQ